MYYHNTSMAQVDSLRTGLLDIGQDLFYINNGHGDVSMKPINTLSAELEAKLRKKHGWGEFSVFTLKTPQTQKPVKR
jgi:hypothetical protein